MNLFKGQIHGLSCEKMWQHKNHSLLSSKTVTLINCHSFDCKELVSMIDNGSRDNVVCQAHQGIRQLIIVLLTDKRITIDL